MQKHSFADVLLNRCSWKLCKFYRKKPVLESLFNKVAGIQVCNFIKKRLRHRCFPVKLAKFLKKHFFTEHLRWLLLMMLLYNQYYWPVHLQHYWKNHYTLEFRIGRTPRLLIIPFFAALPNLIQHSPFTNFGEFC